MNEKGMVLLTTIVMMVMMSLFILSLMQSILLYQKSSAQLLKKQQILHEMEEIGRRLVLDSSPNCLVSQLDPNQMLEDLLHHQGCPYRLGDHDYNYSIADLGMYPCLLIRSHDESVVSHHWMINIHSATYPHLMLQMRFSEPGHTEMGCELHTQFIPRGMISWRIF